ncbi:OmpW family outer membrane protein [Cetobacterium ceti]
MKKFALIGLILSLGVSSFAKDKEMMTQPVVEEEVIVQEIATTPATLETTNENIIKENIKDNHIYFRVGGDIASKYSKYNVKGRSESFKFSNGKTKGLGYEIAIEGTQNITDSLEFGVGIAYQSHSNNKDLTVTSNNDTLKTKMGKYDSIPVYLTGKYNFDVESAWKPYFKVNLGYSFNVNEDKSKINEKDGTTNLKTKVDNGLYTGIGAGIEYDNYLIDILYQTNFAKGTLSNDGDKAAKEKVDYSRVTLSVGYKLDI